MSKWEEEVMDVLIRHAHDHKQADSFARRVELDLEATNQLKEITNRLVIGEDWLIDDNTAPQQAHNRQVINATKYEQRKALDE